MSSDDIKLDNFIRLNEHLKEEEIKKSKLSLLTSKSDNDANKDNDKKEENRRLLGTDQKKIVIVPRSTPVANSLSDNNGGNAKLGYPARIMKPGIEVALSSLRSLKLDDSSKEQSPVATPWKGSFNFSNAASHVSLRSLASIGMGSTDGRKVTIRRVPTTPSELLNIVNPPTPTEVDLSSTSGESSYYDPSDDLAEYRLTRRQHWSNKAQFVLACVGYCVGLGNVWRFPYLCYKSGGGVFLVPYFLILIICGIPMLYMELAVGQYTRRGPIGALGQLCPLFKGAGLASVVISFLMSTYYNVIIAYALYYFFTSFKSDAPWSTCGNLWNTDNCWQPSKILNISKPNKSTTPSEEFFDLKVLHMSDGIDNMGIIRWELAACLIVAWILVYFSIWKGVKSSGKVLYFTATFPYLLIIAFLARALTLEGADLGLRYFFKPQWKLLAESKVWVHAAAQNFNSIGIAFGSVISFSSYNRFNNQILFDTLAVSTINGVTSILVGIFAFATIGNIATEQDTSVDDVISDGPGLIFVVYPQALAKMPASQLWAVLFFFMLLCLCLNSQFAIVEVVVTSIQDGFPNWIKRKLMCHEILVLIVCIVSFVFGLPHIMEGGIYVFQLVDHFAASISIMYLAFFEMIAISWFYGARRLAKNVHEMTGRLPSFYFRFCWRIAAPVLLCAVWIFSLIDYKAPHYNNGEYQYPAWAEVLGWGIASLSLLSIPVYAFTVILKSEGNTLREKVSNSVKSHVEDCEDCGPDKCIHMDTKKKEMSDVLETQSSIDPSSPS